MPMELPQSQSERLDKLLDTERDDLNTEIQDACASCGDTRDVVPDAVPAVTHCNLIDMGPVVLIACSDRKNVFPIARLDETFFIG